MEIIPLNLNNIPEWLQESDLALNLKNNNEEDEMFFVRKEFFRKSPITKIYSADEWLDALKIYSFWGMEFSEYFVIYYLLTDKDIIFKYLVENYDYSLIKNIKIIEQKLREEFSEYILKNYHPLVNDEDITLNTIEKHSILFQNTFHCLSKRSDLTEDFLERHISEMWDWCTIFENYDISFEFIEKHKNYFSFHHISYNKNIPLEYIEKHINEDWNWYRRIIIKNPNITEEFIVKHFDKYWWYRELSSNSNITPEFITKYIDKDWDWNLLSSNPNITNEFVIKYIEKLCNLEKLFKNPKITYFGVELEKFLSNSPNITDNLLRKYNNRKLLYFFSRKIYSRIDVYTLLSENSSITLDFIEKHPKGNWHYYLLSSNNPNITEEFIEKHKEEFWNWNELTKNSNITLEFILKNKDKSWDWKYLFLKMTKKENRPGYMSVKFTKYLENKIFG